MLAHSSSGPKIIKGRKLIITKEQKEETAGEIKGQGLEEGLSLVQRGLKPSNKPRSERLKQKQRKSGDRAKKELELPRMQVCPDQVQGRSPKKTLKKDKRMTLLKQGKR